jgi:hypothetical protein
MDAASPRQEGNPAGARRHAGGRRRRTLPPGFPGSTIRAAGLNDRVRDGNGCVPRAMAAGHSSCPESDARLERTPNPRLSPLIRIQVGRARLREVRTSCSYADQASRAISTARLRRSPALHLPPINVLVSNGPSGVLRPGSAILGGGFPLRCFQRFSRPDVATRRCPGRNSRYTRGRFVPVLSY